MKTNSIFATLLVGIAILIYGCKQSSTQLVPPQNVWVEITDTTHLADIKGLSSVYRTWEKLSGLAIRDTNEYNALGIMIDSIQLAKEGYLFGLKYPLVLPSPPDFSKYSMVGLLYFAYVQDTLHLSFFENDGLKQYHFLYGKVLILI